MYYAIDPGGATGVASVLEDGTAFSTYCYKDGWDLVRDVWQGCAEGDFTAIVMEDYVLSGGGRPKTMDGAKKTIEIIGAVKFAAAYHGVWLTLQSPGDAKLFSTNQKLKAMGWETPSSPDHERSAARHLLLYLTRIGVINPLELLGKMGETKEEQCR